MCFTVPLIYVLCHPGGDPEANLKSISRRCHLFEVVFLWEWTKETIHVPLGCLQGGLHVFHRPRCRTVPLVYVLANYMHIIVLHMFWRWLSVLALGACFIVEARPLLVIVGGMSKESHPQKVDLIRTCIYEKHSGIMKITTHLNRTSHCKTSAGTNLSDRWTYRVFTIDTLRD